MTTLLSSTARRLLLAALGSFLLAVPCFAYNTVWTGADGTEDFFDPGNWSVLVPDNNNSFNIQSNLTATLDTNSSFNSVGSQVYMNYMDLGDSSEATTNQGYMVFNNGFIHMSENAGDVQGIIGWNTNGYSKLVVNGGTVYFDGPDGNVSGKFGALWMQSFGEGSGINGINFDCGTSYSQASGTYNQSNGNGSYGRLELHSNALMRVATVFKIGDMGVAATNAALAYPLVLESGQIVMDGNSELDCGDGFTAGKDLTYTTIDLSGNSKLVIGNSMGAGNTNGSSQQGYFTLGARVSTYTALTIRDNAQLQCMTLQSRAPASVLVTNNAKFMIYNVLAGSGTIKYPYESSYIAGVDVVANPYGEGTNLIFTVADHATFYVDTWGYWGTKATEDVNSNLINGLVIGNGAFTGKIRGGSGYGSKGTLVIQDYATLDIRQSLSLGTAFSTSSDGTLQVVGPNTAITIGSNLSLCIGFDNAAATGATGRLSEFITGPTQSTVTVSNNTLINTQGTLKVTLQGYTPVGGENYLLITNVLGTNDGLFHTFDYSAAPLSPGLIWQPSATTNAVSLQVVNTFNVQPSGTNLMVTWTNQGVANVLQFSTNLANGFTDVVPTATSPYILSPTNAAAFFRLRN
jgi:hypothetical protein